MEFLCKSIFCDFWIFVAFGQGKHAASIGTICYFLGYPENAKYQPDKNCVSRSSHNIVRKLAYLSVKMMSIYQKHEIVMIVAHISVSKLLISLKDI